MKSDFGGIVREGGSVVGELPHNRSAERPKNAAAQELGRLGGKARAAKTTPEQRNAIAKKAAAARWDKR